MFTQHQLNNTTQRGTNTSSYRKWITIKNWL